jgi:hypothetical protein
MYYLDLFLLGLFLRNTSKVLIIFEMRGETERLYGARFKDLVHAIFTKERVSAFIIDKIIIQIY